MNYGFAVEDNRELDGFCPNEVPIELGVLLNDPLYAQKIEFWTRGESTLSAAMAIATSRMSHSITAVDTTTQSAPMKRVRVCVSNNENTRLLFSLLRVLACNEEELTAISCISTSPEHQARLLSEGRSVPMYRSCRDIRHPLSIRNERDALSYLMELIVRALSQYPTTLPQDVTDLQDEDSFPSFSNKRHAKIQVKGEKEVLHHFLRWARSGLEVINVIDEELKVERGEYLFDDGRVSFDYLIREMEEDEGECGGRLHHTIVRYCADVLGSMRREELKVLRRKKAGGGSNM